MSDVDKYTETPRTTPKGPLIRLACILLAISWFASLWIGSMGAMWVSDHYKPWWWDGWVLFPMWFMMPFCILGGLALLAVAIVCGPKELDVIVNWIRERFDAAE